MLLCIAISCLRLGIKYCGDPHMDSVNYNLLCRLVDLENITETQLFRLETRVVQVLHYNLSVPNSFSFLKFFIFVAKKCDDTVSQYFEATKLQMNLEYLGKLKFVKYAEDKRVTLDILARCICERFLLEKLFVNEHSSKIAAASVYLARMVMGSLYHWTATLQHYTGYAANTLFSLCDVLISSLLKEHFYFSKLFQIPTSPPSVVTQQTKFPAPLSKKIKRSKFEAKSQNSNTVADMTNITEKLKLSDCSNLHESLNSKWADMSNIGSTTALSYSKNKELESIHPHMWCGNNTIDSAIPHKYPEAFDCLMHYVHCHKPTV